MVKTSSTRWVPGEAPPDFEQYPAWLAIQGFNYDVESSRYEAAARRIQEDFESSTFWSDLDAFLSRSEAEYVRRTDYPLLAQSGPKLVRKPWMSFWHKTFRVNILNNLNWPGEPDGGWLLPGNWFERVHDVVRTTMVVKYLDGVESLSNAIVRYAEENSHACSLEMEARDTGYYAGHLHLRRMVAIPEVDWSETTREVQLEIQVTTQLQEVMTKLTHRYYEERRKLPTHQMEKWQWDYQSPQFKPNYLGHMLHYTEGIIMEVRDRVESE
jgi:hypothetical protein